MTTDEAIRTLHEMHTLLDSQIKFLMKRHPKRAHYMTDRQHNNAAFNHQRHLLYTIKRADALSLAIKRFKV